MIQTITFLPPPRQTTASFCSGSGWHGLTASSLSVSRLGAFWLEAGGDRRPHLAWKTVLHTQPLRLSSACTVSSGRYGYGGAPPMARAPQRARSRHSPCACVRAMTTEKTDEASSCVHVRCGWVGVREAGMNALPGRFTEPGCVVEGSSGSQLLKLTERLSLRHATLSWSTLLGLQRRSYTAPSAWQRA